MASARTNQRNALKLLLNLLVCSIVSLSTGFQPIVTPPISNRESNLEGTIGQNGDVPYFVDDSSLGEQYGEIPNDLKQLNDEIAEDDKRSVFAQMTTAIKRHSTSGKNKQLSLRNINALNCYFLESKDRRCKYLLRNVYFPKRFDESEGYHAIQHFGRKRRSVDNLLTHEEDTKRRNSEDPHSKKCQENKDTKSATAKGNTSRRKTCKNDNEDISSTRKPIARKLLWTTAEASLETPQMSQKNHLINEKNNEADSRSKKSYKGIQEKSNSQDTNNHQTYQKNTHSAPTKDDSDKHTGLLKKRAIEDGKVENMDLDFADALNLIPDANSEKGPAYSINDQHILDYEKRLDYLGNGHDVMHFGKRSNDIGFDHNVMHFGKRFGHDVMHFGKRFGHDVMHFGKRIPGMEDNHGLMHFGKRIPGMEDNHGLMHFGKRIPGMEDNHGLMHFGKRIPGMEDNHGLMHFGKRSSGMEDNNGLMNFEKRIPGMEDNHGLMHFGKRIPGMEDNHGLMHFGKRILGMEDNHGLMHFGKRIPGMEDDHGLMHFGKRIPGMEDNHGLMHFGKRISEMEDDHGLMHFGKRIPGMEDNHGLMHFGKRIPGMDENHGLMHFGKRYTSQEGEHNVMHFGKRLQGMDENHNVLHFGKRSPGLDQYHNVMHFGKRLPAMESDHDVLHFGKRSEGLNSYHNVMHFGKRFPEAGTSHYVMHFGKRFNEDGHNVLHFGKRSIANASEQNNDNVVERFNPYIFHLNKNEGNVPSNMDFEKRLKDMTNGHNVMHFGKRFDDSSSYHDVMHFGKRENDAEQGQIFLHFGKRSSSSNFPKRFDPSHNVMHFGKRFDPSHNVMHFGKRFDPSHNVMHFGKRFDPSHNVMHFGKRFDPSHNVMHFGKRFDPSHNVMHFGKRFGAEGDHSVLHFGKRTNDSGKSDIFPNEDLQSIGEISYDYSLEEKNSETSSEDQTELGSKIENISKEDTHGIIDSNPSDDFDYVDSNFLEFDKRGIIYNSAQPKTFSDDQGKIPLDSKSNLKSPISTINISDGKNLGSTEDRNKIGTEHDWPEKHSITKRSADSQYDEADIESFDIDDDASTPLLMSSEEDDDDPSLISPVSIKRRRWNLPFRGPKSLVLPNAWLAAHMRRSSFPVRFIPDDREILASKIAEKKELPANLIMHFG